jgi:signal transduction histidine kinase
LPMMTDHPKVAVTAQRIQSSARRMAQMVDQLLDLARIRSGEMRPDLAEADYGALCRLIADEFTTAEHTPRITVQTSGDTVGVCDSGMMSQVLSNLMGNALVHGEPETPVRVTVDGNDPQAITVSVGNRGEIPAELLDSIFEPYKRGTGRKSGQGLGLGLYTARMFIAAHGGDIVVASSKEEGTVFTFKAPRRPVAEPHP